MIVFIIIILLIVCNLSFFSFIYTLKKESIVMEHKKRKPKRNSLVNDILISLECKICGNVSKSNAGLSSHLRWTHYETYEAYVLKYYNIDLIKLDEDYKLSKIENKEKINKEKTKGFKKYTDWMKGKSRIEIVGIEKYEKHSKLMKGYFTLDWYIKKYGKLEGNIKYKERCDKISKSSHFRIYNKSNKNNWSNVSQELFNKIYEVIGNKFNKIYFGELNHEYSCGIQNHNFDFVILDNKKVIEFNGDKFHANPELYNENDIPLKFIGKTSKEIWNDDNEKMDKLKQNGFQIKIIWEKEYLKDKNKIILDCIKFLCSE